MAAKASAPKGVNVQLHYHARDINIQDRDAVFGPSLFPEGKDGEILEICPEGDPKRGIVLMGHRQEKKKEPHQSNPIQLTVLEPVAKCLHIANRTPVLVRILDPRSIPEALELEFVELTFKDVFLSRSDLWRIITVLQGRAVYATQQLEGPDRMRVTVQSLVSRRKEKVLTGVISRTTKIIFRSRSATVYWLWQISAEMWHYTDSGELYFDLAVNSLVRHFVQRWEAGDSAHSIALLFMARVMCHDGTHEDFYKVVKMLNEKRDYEAMRRKLKTHFATFLQSIGCADPFEEPEDEAAGPSHCERCGLMDRASTHTPTLPGDAPQPPLRPLSRPSPESDTATPRSSPLSPHAPPNSAGSSDAGPQSLPPLTRSSSRTPEPEPSAPTGSDPERSRSPSTTPRAEMSFRRGRISSASEGNLLEGINLALNALNAHFIDRNLSHAGQSIGLVTAGNGCWKASPTLSRLTRQRVARTGMPCDVVCLGRPPMHTVPLFELSGRDLATMYEGQDFTIQPDSTYFESPDWLSLHYYRKGKAGYVLYSVNSKGPLDHSVELPPNLAPGTPHSRRPASPPPFTAYTSDSQQYSQEYFDAHDRSVFERPEAPRPDPIVSLRRLSDGTCFLDPVPAAEDQRFPRRRIGRLLPSELISPFGDPSEAVGPQTTKRWAHRRHDPAMGDDNVDNYGFILEPALLPVMTDDWPQVDLKGAHQHNYDVAPAFPQYSGNLRYLLREAVMQRLHRGYQLVQRSEPRQPGAVVERYWLWNGTEVQILSLDDGDVCIKVERRTLPDPDGRTQTDAAVATYEFRNFNNLTDTWQRLEVKFAVPAGVVWNRLDGLISGTLDTSRVGRKESADMQFRRIRMLMITPPARLPGAPPMDPQRRIAAFQKVIQEVHRQTGIKLADHQEVKPIMSDAPISMEFPFDPSFWTHASHPHSPPPLSPGEGSKLVPMPAQAPPTLSQVGSIVVTGTPSASLPSSVQSVQIHTGPPAAKIRLEFDREHDRPLQWLDLYYSRTFNPSCCYTWEVVWTACCGTLVADFVDKLQRRATSNGFAIYFVPCLPTPYLGHPFRSYATIDIPPSPLQDLTATITRRLVEPPFQYVPEGPVVTVGTVLIDPAGDVLIHITDTGFVWFNNYANFTGSITIGQGHPELRRKLADFQEMCASTIAADAALQTVWEHMSFSGPTVPVDDPSPKALPAFPRNASLADLLKWPFGPS